MAQIQPKIEVVIDPTKPVPEICEVISSVCVYHPGNEEAILKGIQDAISKRLLVLEKQKEDSNNGVAAQGKQ